MRRIARWLLCTVSMVVATTPAWAQQAKALLVLPPGGFQFQGSWDCTGSFANGKVHKSTYTGAMILGAKWIELTEQDLEPATGYQAKYLIGYDPQRRQLLEFDANNFGAATYSSTQGWQNDVLAMTSPVSLDDKAPFVADRFIYTIAAPNAFTVDWQIEKTAASAWVTSDHLVCRRIGHS